MMQAERKWSCSYFFIRLKSYDVSNDLSAYFFFKARNRSRAEMRPILNSSFITNNWK